MKRPDPSDLKISRDEALLLKRQQEEATKVPPANIGAFAVGQLIADRYRVVKLLGQGGMGLVYEVENVFLKKRCALKVLSSQSEVALRRFQQEAKAASRLDHPALLKVQDFGLIGGEQPYLLMDLVSGAPLSSVIKNGPLPFDAVVNIFKQICFGLSYAHSQGVIHRDIKPSNVIVTNPGDLEHTSVIIIDLGIAKVTGLVTEVNSLTRTGEPIGTPFYMSPEQCMGLAVDTKSDIYSVGCMLFECLTGLPPFIGESALSTMMKHQSDAPPTLKQATLGAEFPSGLQEVLDKLLAKKPADRYSDLIKLAIDLDRVKAHEEPELGRGSEHDTPPDNKPIQWSLLVLAIVAAMCVGSAVSWMLMKQTPLHHDEVSTISFDMAKAISQAVGVPGASEAIMHQTLTVPGATEAIMHQALTAPVEPLVSSLPKTSFSADIPGQPGSRLFQFSQDRMQNLGGFSTIGDDPKIFLKENAVFTALRIEKGGTKGGFSREILAKGTFIVQNFQGFRFKPTQFLCSHLELFNQFKPDDIKAIHFDGYLVDWSDHDLSHLKRFSDMQQVDLQNVGDLKDGALDVLCSMRKLKILHLHQGSMSRNALSKSTAFHNLENLQLESFKDTDVVLKQLADAPNLASIAFNRCKLTKDDLKLLAKIPKLQVLSISNDTELTDDDLTPLAQCHQLLFIFLRCSKLTADVSQSLKGLQHLDGLRINLDEAACAEMARALPRCKVASSKSYHENEDTAAMQEQLMKYSEDPKAELPSAR